MKAMPVRALAGALLVPALALVLVAPASRAVPLSNLANRPLCISADLDGNGSLDRGDLYYMADAWLSADPAADLDGSGRVDTIDLRILLDCSPGLLSDPEEIGRFPDLGRG